MIYKAPKSVWTESGRINEMKAVDAELSISNSHR